MMNLVTDVIKYTYNTRITGCGKRDTHYIVTQINKRKGK